MRGYLRKTQREKPREGKPHENFMRTKYINERANSFDSINQLIEMNQFRLSSV